MMALTLMLVMLTSAVCFAAVSSSGSKSSSSSRSSTSAPPSKQAAPSGTYKPSASADSYSNTAPAKQTTQPQSSSNSFLRNASMIGGGFLAGSLLGNLFGTSNMGGQSSIFGMLINLLMIGAVVMGIRYLWNKYKNKDRQL